MWCSVVVVVVVVLTTVGAVEAIPARQCPAGEACVPLSVCNTLQDQLGSQGPAALQAVKDADCGKDENGDVQVCCPEPKEETKGRRNTRSLNGEHLLPSHDVCGLHFESSFRIMFGEDAPIYTYPWIALLGYGDKSHPSWLCGGTLINDRYALTAAHCVHSNHTSKDNVGPLVTIRLGENNVDSNPDCSDAFTKLPCAPAFIDFSPEELILHESYGKRAPFSDDIALVRLDTVVTMSVSIQPMCLPASYLDIKEFLGPRDALVAGWGVSERSFKTKTLQVAKVPLADKKKCEEHYPSQLMDEQLCFGGRGKVDSCFGDSGGPAFQTIQQTDQFMLLGIVSFGMPKCGIPGIPSIYTNVASYRTWIVDNLKP